MSIDRSPNESWDFMLPGPPSRNNGGSADLSPTGLLAYAAGCSVSVVDSRSMQLITVIPLPPPSLSSNSTSTPSLSPFVTSVRWSPHPLRRDILSHDPSSAPSHLLLAAGDRQGRIALLDLRLKSPLLFLDTADSKLGIQDLCWIQSRPDSWILAALSGPSHLSLYNTSTGRCFFKYDAAPELFSCIRRDPFDSRHFCAIGLRGFLLSVKVLNDNSEDDVSLKELQIPTDSSELQRLERDATAVANPNTTSPSLTVFPTYIAKCAFSPHWRHILFVTFPRELVVFDLRYETTLFGTALPRGFGKFFEVLADPSMELLYCAHLDGKLSTWRRKEGEQVHMMCMMEELIPSIGTSVPSPSVLAVVISLSDSTLQNIGKHCSNISHTPLEVDFDNPFDFYDESLIISKTHLISISDDGKIWNWLLTAEGTGESPKDETNSGIVSKVNKVQSLETNAEVTFGGEPALDAVKQPEDVTSATSYLSNPTISQEEMLFKV